MTHHRARHYAGTTRRQTGGYRQASGDVVKHRLEDLELEANVLRDVYKAAR